MTVLAVAVGGALGALLRVAVGQLWPVDLFPWSTLLVNVSGTTALALLPALAVVHRRPLLAPLLGTGVLGGYTTLSTASAETVALGDDGRPLLDGMVASVRQRALPAATEHTNFALTDLGDVAEVQGACLLALHDALRSDDVSVSN